jgi:hypothetical protein
MPQLVYYIQQYLTYAFDNKIVYIGNNYLNNIECICFKKNLLKQITFGTTKISKFILKKSPLLLILDKIVLII